MKGAKVRARALFAALALAGLVTGAAFAQNAPPPPYESNIPGVPGIQMPSPLPEPTISGTPLPYPAYGTPAPDVEAEYAATSELAD